jgi:hypothetical protein
MRTRLAASLLISTLLAGCGGGSGGAGTNSTPTSTYTFMRPKPGSHRVYAQKLVDNLNNTVNRTIVTDVTAVNADGSFAVHQEDPSHNRIVSGSVDQTFYPGDYQYNASAQPLSWVITHADGGTVRCAISQGNVGAPSPMTVGQNWTATYTETCGSGSGIAHTQSGTLVSMETISVPAGTFSAFKFTSTITRTVNGTTRTETVSNWRDASGTDSRSLKSQSAFTYSGTAPPPGSLVSETRELQSYQ